MPRGKKFTAEQIVTLMSGSLAVRLEKPSFMEAFNGLSDKFTTEQIVTLRSGSLAARLEKPRFMEAYSGLHESPRLVPKVRC